MIAVPSSLAVAIEPLTDTATELMVAL